MTKRDILFRMRMLSWLVLQNSVRLTQMKSILLICSWGQSPFTEIIHTKVPFISALLQAGPLLTSLAVSVQHVGLSSPCPWLLHFCSYASRNWSFIALPANAHPSFSLMLECTQIGMWFSHMKCGICVVALAVIFPEKHAAKFKWRRRFVCLALCCSLGQD